jgi:hypothetical protein
MGLERRIVMASFEVDYAPIFERLIEDAGNQVSRWIGLMDLAPHLPPALFDVVIDRLERTDMSGWADKEKQALRDRLREAATPHLRFPDAPWAMPRERAQKLLALADRFTIDDPLMRFAWLFGVRVELPDADLKDWQAQEAAASAERARAVRVLYESGGADLLISLSDQVAAPWTVGVAAADAQVAPDPIALIELALHSENERRIWFVRTFLLRLRERDGEDSIRKILADERSGSWPVKWRALVFTTLEFGPATWASVVKDGPAVSREYWWAVPLHGLGKLDRDRVRTIAGRLTEVDNYSGAIGFLALYAESADAIQVLEVIEAAASPDFAQTITWDRVGRDVLSLFGVVQSSKEVDQDRVAILEWRLVPLTGIGEYAPRALHQKLSRDPAFFVELISLVYRGEGEARDEEPSEQRKSIATRAYQLLAGWHVPPGRTEAGTIDAAELRAWIREARELSRQAGRLVVADIHIGDVLSYAPIGEDGVWPAEPIRDLIEDIQSDELDRGLIQGVFNSRGVTTRALTDGGAQERELAQKYANTAKALRNRWPRVAATIDRIADDYERQARREDIEAEMERREVGDA